MHSRPREELYPNSEERERVTQAAIVKTGHLACAIELYFGTKRAPATFAAEPSSREASGTGKLKQP